MSEHLEYHDEQSANATDRDSRGRFTAGNRAAIGHGTRSRDNLFTFRGCITDDDIIDLAKMLLEKAKAGDMTAMKLLLTYCLPQPAVLLAVEERRRHQEEQYLRCGYYNY